jgi:hypothetical protein
VELAREVFAQRAFEGLRGKELAPGDDTNTKDEVRFFRIFLIPCIFTDIFNYSIFFYYILILNFTEIFIQ